MAPLLIRYLINVEGCCGPDFLHKQTQHGLKKDGERKKSKPVPTLSLSGHYRHVSRSARHIPTVTAARGARGRVIV